MQMRVMQQVLSPGMQNGEEAKAGSEMFRVAGNGEQGFGGGVEKDVVDRLFVVKGDLGDRLGNRENDVEVGHRQQFGLSASRSVAFGPLRPLALRAVAVPAGVVGVTRFRAVVAFFEMTTKDRGATNLDGSHDTQLLQRKRVSFPVSSAVPAKNVGHFQSGPWHPESISGAFASA